MGVKAVYPGAMSQWQSLTLRDQSIPVIRFRCMTCSKPISAGFAIRSGNCWACDNEPQTRIWKKWISGMWALTVYISDEPRFPSTGVVRRSKQESALAGEMLRVAARAFAGGGGWAGGSWSPDVTVPCPSHPDAKVPRSAAMAKGAGDVFNVSAQDVLRRVDSGPPRAKSHSPSPPDSGKEFESKMRVVASSGNLTGVENVLLVDDVMTHGVTAGASAKALMEAGAKDVRMLLFARSTDRVHLEGYCD